MVSAEDAERDSERGGKTYEQGPTRGRVVGPSARVCLTGNEPEVASGVKGEGDERDEGTREGKVGSSSDEESRAGLGTQQVCGVWRTCKGPKEVKG
jgi:hypothetical protein